MQRFPSGKGIPGLSGTPRIMVVVPRPGKEAPERESRDTGQRWCHHGRGPGEKTYPQGMCYWANQFHCKKTWNRERLLPGEGTLG